jgi:hypothetical protein
MHNLLLALVSAYPVQSLLPHSAVVHVRTAISGSNDIISSLSCLKQSAPILYNFLLDLDSTLSAIHQPLQALILELCRMTEAVFGSETARQFALTVFAPSISIAQSFTRMWHFIISSLNDILIRYYHPGLSM